MIKSFDDFVSVSEPSEQDSVALLDSVLADFGLQTDEDGNCKVPASDAPLFLVRLAKAVSTDQLRRYHEWLACQL